MSNKTEEQIAADIEKMLDGFEWHQPVSSPGIGTRFPSVKIVYRTATLEITGRYMLSWNLPMCEILGLKRNTNLGIDHKGEVKFVVNAPKNRPGYLVGAVHRKDEKSPLKISNKDLVENLFERWGFNLEKMGKPKDAIHINLKFDLLEEAGDVRIYKVSPIDTKQWT